MISGKSLKMSGTFSVSSVIASANATFGIQATNTASTSIAYTYSHPVTAGKYGHVQFGNYGWKMSVRKTVINNLCAITSDVTGTVTQLPSSNVWGFNYWETSS